VNLSITLEQPDKKLALFGSADRYLRMIRDTFGVQLVNRDDEIKVSGEKDQVARAVAVLEQQPVLLLTPTAYRLDVCSTIRLLRRWWRLMEASFTGLTADTTMRKDT